MTPRDQEWLVSALARAFHRGGADTEAAARQLAENLVADPDALSHLGQALSVAARATDDWRKRERESMRRQKPEPPLSREEKARRLQFTDADREALAFVPPGPEPVEVLAARGVTWAQELLQTRADHAKGGHWLDAHGWCARCQQAYARAEGT